jgi:hypothetical protein
MDEAALFPEQCRLSTCGFFKGPVVLRNLGRPLCERAGLEAQRSTALIKHLRAQLFKGSPPRDAKETRGELLKNTA